MIGMKIMLSDVNFQGPKQLTLKLKPCGCMEVKPFFFFSLVFHFCFEGVGCRIVLCQNNFSGKA